MSTFSPEFVMNELAQLFPVVYASLSYGTFQAKDYFDNQSYEEDKKIDSYLAPHLVRHHALHQLKREGQDAYADNGISFNDIPFSGIHINFGRYQVKVLKSNKGDLPIPGHSKARMAYYDNQFFDWGDNDPSTVKLLLLWNVDSSYSLSVLSLAFPKSGGISRDSVSAHWHCKIPKNILYGEYKADDEIQIEEIFDLPIERIDLDQTGTDDEK